MIRNTNPEDEASRVTRDILCRELLLREFLKKRKTARSVGFLSTSRLKICAAFCSDFENKGVRLDMSGKVFRYFLYPRVVTRRKSPGIKSKAIIAVRAPDKNRGCGFPFKTSYNPVNHMGGKSLLKRFWGDPCGDCSKMERSKGLEADMKKMS